MARNVRVNNVEEFRKGSQPYTTDEMMSDKTSVAFYFIRVYTTDDE